MIFEIQIKKTFLLRTDIRKLKVVLITIILERELKHLS